MNHNGFSVNQFFLHSKPPQLFVLKIISSQFCELGIWAGLRKFFWVWLGSPVCLICQWIVLELSDGFSWDACWSLILHQASSGLFTTWWPDGAPREQVEAARPLRPRLDTDTLSTCSAFFWSVQATRLAQIPGGGSRLHPLMGVVVEQRFRGHRYREDGDFCTLSHLKIFFFQYFTDYKSQFCLL